MTEQPTALRLADALADYTGCTLAQMDQAAAELRRLHAERTAADDVINDLAAKVRGLHTQRDALLKMLKDVLPVAEDASESLGRFCGDEGWAQEDMDRMDNVDGMLPLIRAAIKAVEGEK